VTSETGLLSAILAFKPREEKVKILLLSIWLCIGAMPAFAQNNNDQGQNNNNQGQNGYHGAPAPLIGFGLPAVLAVGGVLVGVKLLKRRK
jgi:hypothetical protein